MKFRIAAQIKNVSGCVNHAPTLRELRLQTRSVVGAQERVVNQITDADGIGIGRIARVELQRIAFDARDEITRRPVG